MSDGTAYYSLQADRARCERAVRAVAEGHALRATARMVQGDKETVGAWLERVARHCRMVMLSLGHNWHVLACQLDALGRFVPTQEAHLPGAKLSCATSGDAGVWVAFAPVGRLGWACVSGKRDHASADVLLARVAHVTADSIAFCPSDPGPGGRACLVDDLSRMVSA